MEKEIMEIIPVQYPKCPKCKEGVLVPFSMNHDVFEKWKCTVCGHEVKKK